MTGLVFLDTSILLYAVDSRDAEKHARAREWLESLWRTRSGRTSTQVLSEFFVNATQRLEPSLTPDEAWQQVSGLRAWRPHAIDLESLELGRQLQVRYHLSWWDSLVVAAAQLQGCSILLTEDLQHGSEVAGVTITNPFMVGGVHDLRAIYAPMISPSPRRTRGRPRRGSAAATTVEP